MSKYTHVEWSDTAHDYVPAKRRPSRFWAGLLEPVGNAIGTALLFIGIVAFIAICHLA